MKHLKLKIISFLTVITASSICLSSQEIQSNVPEIVQNKFIEGEYIIHFKTPHKGKESFIEAPNPSIKGRAHVPFGEHSTNQSKKGIIQKLGLKGEVLSVLDNINAIFVKMNAQEAYRISKHPFVDSVEQNIIGSYSVIQNNSGWGLDRIDSLTATLNGNYDYDSTGAGRTIYILDSGLNLSNQAVSDEFSNRADVIWALDGDTQNDCVGHGTAVSSAAAGNTYGTAKGVNVIVGKISNGCSGPDFGWAAVAVNWIANNAVRGSIINLSIGRETGNCNIGSTHLGLENAIRAAHASGMMIVVAAGNDGCNTANYTPTNIPESFVVGATSDTGLNTNDRKASFSRTGWNISGFAPGQGLALLGLTGQQVTMSGTSFSAPYVAGVIAVACEAAGTVCSDGTFTTAELYDAIRNLSPTNTVVDPDGTPLTGATSRFISQQW